MIEWTRISELIDEVGEEDFAEIADLFLSEIRNVASHLPEAAGPAELAERLHSLKGSALNLGFLRLADLCSQGEAAPATADIPGIREATREATAAFLQRYPDLA